MEEWTVVGKLFASEQEARKLAGIIQTTETRLANTSSGAQFDIETELIQSQDGWQIRWRKVFKGYQSGCGSCSSCNDQGSQHKGSGKMGKVIELRPRSKA